MAHGRMLNKTISLNKELADLQSDASRLLFTWTIAHLDVEGRIHGDPEVLKSIVVPRIKHITSEVVEQCIKEWATKGLVIWYTAGGDQWLQFPGFHENQKGLKKDREAASKIPAPEEGSVIPTHEEVPSNSGVDSEELTPNRKEENIKEKNTSSGTSSRSSSGKGKLQLPDEDKELYHKIKDAFLSQNDTFTNWKKEGEAIKRLVKTAKARSPDDPEGFIHQMIEKFWELKRGNDKFWSSQPFTPSALSAAGIFDRVLETFREEEIPDELQKYYAEKAI